MDNKATFVFLCLIFVKDTLTISISIDGKLNFTELATKYGHGVEEYDVITNDGYILKLFHIPGSSKVPVLLMHGIYESADIWIIRGNTSLAITLANQGYDVWAGNCRGNRYARRHIYLDPDAKDGFWDFSFHEFGFYDLAAIIDTVLQSTSADRVTAVGHSQGTTIFYVLGSTRPEYNAKINVMIALAPICFLQNVPPPLGTLMAISPELDIIAKSLNIQELSRDRILHTICSIPGIGYTTCVLGGIFPLVGYDIEELNEKFFSTFIGHFPTGTSEKNLIHFGQVGIRKTFAAYDYGEKINFEKYNSSSPPEYDLDRVTMKVVLFVGTNDKISTLNDVAILRQKLPNVFRYQLIPRKKMNHLDFVVGEHMNDYLYPYIFDVLEELEVEANNTNII